MPDLDPELPESTLVTVYEAVNDTLKELYVGLSTYFVPEIERRLRSKLTLSHWSAGDRVVIRALEYGIPLHTARDFAQGYARSRASAGWTVVSANLLPDTAKPRAGRSRQAARSSAR